MRATLCLLIVFVAGCAAQSELAPAPPAGVDLSGHWRLNVADSDDPLRLTQALAAGGGSPGQEAGGGRRGSRGSRQSGSLPSPQPIVIPTTLAADVLRWPGAEVAISQQGGTVTMESDGDSRAYRPMTGPASRGDRARKGRRSAGPAVCGWFGASLIVRTDVQGDQPGFDARYRLSDDGTRLLQIITLQGGRITGFTLSRVWDRE